tara:strand:- start:5977 stop:6369 length:393 start_codon:yes stop_codon:yes gene_type:complete
MLVSKSKFMSAIFLLGSLSVNLDFCCEFQKLPNLFEHFSEHQQFNGDSFLDFLAENYLKNDGEQKHHDTNDHENLPFHGAHQCSHAPLFYTFDFKILPENPGEPADSAQGRYLSFYTSNYTDGPFHPPKG